MTEVLSCAVEHQGLDGTIEGSGCKQSTKQKSMRWTVYQNKCSSGKLV